MRKFAVGLGGVLVLALGVTAMGQQGTPAAAPKPAATAPARAAAQAPAAQKPVRAAAATKAPGMSVASQNELVKTYCATCHSEKAKAGGLVLSDFDATKAQEHPERVEKMIRKLRTGMIPPAGAKRPDEATIEALTGSLVNTNDPLKFGGNAVWGEYFKGKLDEIRVWKTARTQSQVASDMNAAI